MVMVLLLVFSNNIKTAPEMKRVVFGIALLVVVVLLFYGKHLWSCWDVELT